MSQTAEPIISVVMANKNGTMYLEQAVHSVLCQSVQNLELVFVDDASTDDSLSKIRAMATVDDRIRIIEKSASTGAAAARNVAIEAITSPWIAICDSDDVMHPDRLANLLAFAENKQADMVADDCIHFAVTPMEAPRTVMGIDRDLVAHKLNAVNIVETTAIGYLKPLIKRSLLSNSPYREDLTIGEDFQLYLELVLGGAEFWLSPTAQYLYRRMPGSLSFRSQPEQIYAQLVTLRETALNTTGQPAAFHRAMRHCIKKLEAAYAQESFARALKHGNVFNAAFHALKQPKPIWGWIKKNLKNKVTGTSGREIDIQYDFELLSNLAETDENTRRRYFAKLCYQASFKNIELVAETKEDLSAAWMLPAVNKVTLGKDGLDDFPHPQLYAATNRRVVNS